MSNNYDQNNENKYSNSYDENQKLRISRAARIRTRIRARTGQNRKGENKEQNKNR